MSPVAFYIPPDPTLPSFRTRYRRPHIYPGGGTLAVTMRLAGSVTRPTIRRIQAIQERYGNQVPPAVYWSATAEERLAFRQVVAGAKTRRALNGPFHLHHHAGVRELILAAILEEQRRGGWEVLAVSLMPNHAHLVLRHTHPTRHMGTVLRLWKSFTAREANKLLGMTGQPFWEHENYDTVVTTADALSRHLHYVLSNPVVCRLATTWKAWPGNYCAPRLLAAMNPAVAAAS